MLFFFLLTGYSHFSTKMFYRDHMVLVLGIKQRSSIVNL